MNATPHAGRVMATLLLTVGMALNAASARAADGASSPESSDWVSLLVVPVSANQAWGALPQERSARRMAVVRHLREQAAQFSPELLAWMRQQGGTPTVLWAAQRIAVRLPASSVARLNLRRDVASVSLDRRFLLSPGPRRASAMLDSGQGADWHLEAVQAKEAWAAGYVGEGALIAIVDSGVDPFAANLQANWREDNGWYDTFGTYDSPHDLDGHGTQALALAVGGEVAGIPVGVAPKARWIAARVFDDQGNSDLSHVHLALQWVLDPDGDPATDDAPDVVTSSWGFSEQVNQCLHEFDADVAALRAADIDVVFAVGNAGPDSATTVSPGNTPGVLAVGAVNSQLELALDSSRGPSPCHDQWIPQLVAPGVAVRTADLTAGGIMANSVVWIDGTSAAAPQVAGALALLRGAAPEATSEQLRNALFSTSDDLGESGPDFDSGFGLVRALDALEFLCDPSDGQELCDSQEPEDDLDTEEDDVVAQPDTATEDVNGTDKEVLETDLEESDSGNFDGSDQQNDLGGKLTDLTTEVADSVPIGEPSVPGPSVPGSGGQANGNSGCSASPLNESHFSLWWALILIFAWCVKPIFRGSCARPSNAPG